MQIRGVSFAVQNEKDFTDEHKAILPTQLHVISLLMTQKTNSASI